MQSKNPLDRELLGALEIALRALEIAVCRALLVAVCTRGFVVPFRLETPDGRVVYSAVWAIGSDAEPVVRPLKRLARKLARQVALELGPGEGDDIRPDEFEAVLAGTPRETGLDFATLIDPFAAIREDRLALAVNHGVVDPSGVELGNVSLAVWEGPLAPGA